MLRNFSGVGAFIGAVGLVLSGSATATAATVYGVEISPDGKHYAILRDAGDQRAFAVYSVDDSTAKPVGIGLGTIDIVDFEWGGNDRLLVQVSGEKDGIRTNTGLKNMTISRWMAIDSVAGKSSYLFGNERGVDYSYYIGSAGALLAALPLDNENALFARTSVAIRKTGPTRLKEGTDELLYSLQRASFKSGDARLIKEGSTETIDWAVDASGAAIARLDQNPKSKSIEVFDAQKSKQAGSIPGELVVGEKMEFAGPAGPDAPRALLFAVERDGARRLVHFDLDSGALKDAPSAPEGSIVSVIYDPREARPRVAYYEGGARRGAFHFDEADRKSEASLKKALPGAVVAIVSKSVDGDRMIVRADYIEKSEEYYLYDRAAKRLDMVAAN